MCSGVNLASFINNGKFVFSFSPGHMLGSFRKWCPLSVFYWFEFPNDYFKPHNRPILEKNTRMHLLGHLLDPMGQNLGLKGELHWKNENFVCIIFELSLMNVSECKKPHVKSFTRSRDINYFRFLLWRHFRQEAKNVIYPNRRFWKDVSTIS